MKRCGRFQRSISCKIKITTLVLCVAGKYNYTSVPVVHQEHFQLLGVVHKEFIEAVGQQVSGVLVGA